MGALEKYLFSDTLNEKIETIKTELSTKFTGHAFNATQPHESRSGAYRFVNSLLLAAMILAVLPWAKLKTIKYRRSKTGLGKHIMIFGLGKFIGNDELELIVVNSHDGSSSVQFYFGIRVSACSNGMIFGHFLLPKIKVLHRGLTYQKIDTALSNILTYVEKIEIFVNKLKNTVLTQEQKSSFLSEALKIRGLEVGAELTTIDRARREVDQGDAAWPVFQRVQENLTRGFTVIQGGKVKSIQAIRSPMSDLEMNVKLLDTMLKLVA